MALSLIVIIPGQAYQLIATANGRRFFLGVFSPQDMYQLTMNGVRVEDEA